MGFVSLLVQSVEKGGMLRYHDVETRSYTTEVRLAEKAKEKKPPNIDIYKAWCKACGICVAFCPTGALAKDEMGSPYVKDPEKCAKCGLCELRCPDFAITVHEKKERQPRGGQ